MNNKKNYASKIKLARTCKIGSYSITPFYYKVLFKI